jgi:hypothetical protein
MDLNNPAFTSANTVHQIHDAMGPPPAGRIEHPEQAFVGLIVLGALLAAALYATMRMTYRRAMRNQVR